MYYVQYVSITVCTVFVAGTLSRMLGAVETGEGVDAAFLAKYRMVFLFLYSIGTLR